MEIIWTRVGVHGIERVGCRERWMSMCWCGIKRGSGSWQTLLSSLFKSKILYFTYANLKERKRRVWGRRMALNDDASRKTTGSVLSQKRNLPLSNTSMAIAATLLLGIGYMVYVNRSRNVPNNNNNNNINRQTSRWFIFFFSRNMFVFLFFLC